jgi:hypothetical protein
MRRSASFLVMAGISVTSVTGVFLAKEEGGGGGSARVAWTPTVDVSGIIRQRRCFHTGTTRANIAEPMIIRSPARRMAVPYVPDLLASPAVDRTICFQTQQQNRYAYRETGDSGSSSSHLEISTTSCRIADEIETDSEALCFVTVGCVDRFPLIRRKKWKILR